MTATYVHLAGRDIDGAILGVYGIKLEDKEEGKNGKSHLPAPIECLRCKERNPEGARFCSKCGMGLSLHAVVELEEKRARFDEVLFQMLKKPSVQKAFEDAMRELGISEKVLDFSDE